VQEMEFEMMESKEQGNDFEKPQNFSLKITARRLFLTQGIIKKM